MHTKNLILLGLLFVSHQCLAGGLGYAPQRPSPGYAPQQYQEDLCKGKWDWKTDVHSYLQKASECRVDENVPAKDGFIFFRCKLNEHATLTKLRLSAATYFVHLNATKDSNKILGALYEDYKPLHCVSATEVENRDPENAKGKLEYRAQASGGDQQSNKNQTSGK